MWAIGAIVVVVLALVGCFASVSIRSAWEGRKKLKKSERGREDEEG